MLEVGQGCRVLLLTQRVLQAHKLLEVVGVALDSMHEQAALQKHARRVILSNLPDRELAQHPIVSQVVGGVEEF